MKHVPKVALLLALVLTFAPGCGPAGEPREEAVIPEEPAASAETVIPEGPAAPKETVVPAEPVIPEEAVIPNGPSDPEGLGAFPPEFWTEAAYYPSENQGTKFIRHGKFTFWIEVPDDWRAYDWSANGGSYKIESGDDNIVMSLSGLPDWLYTETNTLPDFIFNRDDGSVLSEFVFDSGISGWQIEKTDEFIIFRYRSEGRFPAFRVDYEKNPAWFAENREKIIEIAKTMNDGARCDGVLFTKDMKTLVSYPKDKEDEAYTVPDGVTTIEKMTFFYCEYLARITIPGSVKIIEDEAFWESPQLQEINVAENSESYTSRDGVLFTKDMKTLVYYPEAKEGSEYVIPDGVTRIQSGAIRRCENLVMITIPDSVTSIADFSFQYFDLTIHAGEGSYAAGYARKHRIRLKFKAVPGI